MDEIGTPLRLVRRFSNPQEALYILGRTREAYRRYMHETAAQMRRYETALRQAIAEIKRLRGEVERYQALYDKVLRERSQAEREVEERVEKARLEVAESVDTLTTEEVLAFFKEHNGATQKEAQEYFEVTYPTLRRRIDVLLDNGALRKDGHSFYIK